MPKRTDRLAALAFAKGWNPRCWNVTRLALTFEEAPDGRGKPGSVVVEVDFAELQGASDTLLLGFPQLAEWGLVLSKDEDGYVWVEFPKLGVTLLSETVAVRD